MDTKIFKVDENKPDLTVIKIAAQVIRSGGLVAFPTETVYGLGANYFSESAMDKIYEVKERPRNKPLTVTITNIDTLHEFVDNISIFEQVLMERFWPGPLTLIFRARNGQKLGVRMPKNRIAQELLREANVPIALPSANLSGYKAPQAAEEVIKYLNGKIDIILDGGPTDFGIESTVLDVSEFPFRILREGAIRKSQIADAGRSVMAEIA